MASVTEVVWEGDEPDTKSDSNSAKTAENNSVKNALSRLDCICLTILFISFFFNYVCVFNSDMFAEGKAIHVWVY